MIWGNKTGFSLNRNASNRIVDNMFIILPAGRTPAEQEV
jgi:hypothetical protein